MRTPSLQGHDGPRVRVPCRFGAEGGSPKQDQCVDAVVFELFLVHLHRTVVANGRHASRRPQLKFSLSWCATARARCAGGGMERPTCCVASQQRGSCTYLHFLLDILFFQEFEEIRACLGCFSSVSMPFSGTATTLRHQEHLMLPEPVAFLLGCRRVHSVDLVLGRICILTRRLPTDVVKCFARADSSEYLARASRVQTVQGAGKEAWGEARDGAQCHTSRGGWRRVPLWRVHVRSSEIHCGGDGPI